MSTVTLTLRVDHDVPRHNVYGRLEPTTETLCNVSETEVSHGMAAAMLRQLADELDPPRTNNHERSPF